MPPPHFLHHLFSPHPGRFYPPPSCIMIAWQHIGEWSDNRGRGVSRTCRSPEGHDTPPYATPSAPIHKTYLE